MTNLIISDNPIDETKEEKVLRQKVQLLKEKLLSLTEKLEQLNVNLAIVKQEYDIRIGRLYLKIDELDLEIFKLKKIEDLLSRGFSHEEAKKIIEETINSRQKTIKEEYAKLDEEEEIIEKRKNISESEREELKKLWRQLAHKYHPDLARNEEDRKKREKIMKKINKAYSDYDLEALKAIEQEHVENVDFVSAEILKTKLKNLTTAIAHVNKEYSKLKKTEWYILKNNIEKAKNKGHDLLFELEQKISKDIETKKAILRDCQK